MQHKAMRSYSLIFGVLAAAIAGFIHTSTASANFDPSHAERLAQPLYVHRLELADIDASITPKTLAASGISELRFGSGVSIPLTLQLVTELPTHGLTKQLEKPDSFLIEISSRSIDIRSESLSGLWYGLDQLLVELAENDGELEYKFVYDGADHGVRAFHMVLRSLSVDDSKRLIALAHKNRFNTLVILLADGVDLNSDAVSARQDAMSSAELQEIVAYARSLGMRFVPEVSLLTHQGRFFRNRHPQLMYNTKTYDPRNPAVYELVFDYLDELIALTMPDAVHIGHDEVAGTYNLARKGRQVRPDQALPPELFQADILTLHEFLTAQNIEVWMWGDMLVSADEVNKPRDPNLHGGFGHAAIRPQLPKDIVVCDWHYWDKSGSFPSAKLLASEGFRVLGTTWKKQPVVSGFSRYINDLDVGGHGMIATTWWHVQKREWPVVEQIAVDSGQAFWRASGAN